MRIIKNRGCNIKQVGGERERQRETEKCRGDKERLIDGWMDGLTYRHVNALGINIFISYIPNVKQDLIG